MILSEANKTIRGYTLRQILDVVSATEKKLSISVPEPKPTRYLKFGPWLIRQEYANGPRPQFVERLVMESKIGFGIKLKQWIKSFRPITAQCQADVIRMRHHCRAFYIDRPQPFTVKIAIGQNVQSEPFHREVYTRQKLLEFGHLNAPGIQQIHLDETPPYFVEDFIDGEIITSASDWPLLEDLLKHLQASYRDCGVLQQSANDVFPSRMIEKINSLISQLDWDVAWGSKDSLLTEITSLLNKNIQLSCSVGHGDLYLGNILKKNGKLYLYDWEYSSSMPTAVDLAKLLLDLSVSLDIPARKLMDTFREDRSYLAQLGLAFVNMLVQRDKEFSDVNAKRAESINKAMELTAVTFDFLRQSTPSRAPAHQI